MDINALNKKILILHEDQYRSQDQNSASHAKRQYFFIMFFPAFPFQVGSAFLNFYRMLEQRAQKVEQRGYADKDQQGCCAIIQHQRKNDAAHETSGKQVSQQIKRAAHAGESEHGAD